MEFMNNWWGIVEDISPLETFLCAIAMFIIAVVMVRVSGMRSFGKGDGVDMVIVFLIGAILSRGVVGATPFFSAIAGGIGILLVHNLLLRLTLYNKYLGRKIKGKSIVLFRNGEFVHENMNKSNISEHDVIEELRLNLQINSMDKIDEAYLERTGEISFVKKEEHKAN